MGNGRKGPHQTSITPPRCFDLDAAAQLAAFARLQLVINRVLNELWRCRRLIRRLEVVLDRLVNAVARQLFIDSLLGPITGAGATDAPAGQDHAAWHLVGPRRRVALPLDITEGISPY